MLQKIFGSFRKPVMIAPALPTGRRLYAIGDIHGRLDLLDALLDQIDADDARRGEARTGLIFLGDLVDRGPHSAEVVDRLIGLDPRGRDVRYLMGNHEEILLRLLDGDLKASRLFCKIGGRETALSYGLTRAEFDALDHLELVEAMQARVPPKHRVFMDGFEDLIVEGDYAFVHAGVDPAIDLESQTQQDLRWIRNPFLDHGDRLAKMIVHGHTVTESVERRAHRIGIDTGAYASGRLTALGLEGNTSWDIQTIATVSAQPATEWA